MRIRASPAASRYTGPPMTLGNMRANGVRSIAVTCWLCHHRAVLSVDSWSDHVPVPSFRPRMVCTSGRFRSMVVSDVAGWQPSQDSAPWDVAGHRDAPTCRTQRRVQRKAGRG
jgi:hypothetical protein